MKRGFRLERADMIRHIDEGANFYLRLLGDASHMEYVPYEYYSIIRPKNGEEGLSIVFEINLEQLTDADIAQKVDEIKRLNIHTWWGISQSERVLNAIWKGQQRPQKLPEPNDEEAYMALLPEEMPLYSYGMPAIVVKRVVLAEDFKIWAAIINQVLHGGYRIIHPQNHFHLCEKGVMTCYLGYYADKPASGAAIMDNQCISSLEFVATLPDYRRKGLAKAICAQAVEEAFRAGSKIITLRSSPEAKMLYLTLGFKMY